MGRGRIIGRIAGWAALGVATASAGAVAWMVGSVAFPNPARRWREWGKPEDFGLDDLERVRLPDDAPAWFIPRGGVPTAVLVCHGRSRNKAWMLPLIARLAERWPVLAFDFPSHGEQRSGTTTIGLREARSVHAAIDWLEARGFTRVLIFGESMGGVATLLALGSRPRPTVVAIATSGVFDDLGKLLELAGDQAHMPAPLQRVARRLTERLAGYRIEAVCPIEAIARVDLPILLLHGKIDELIPVPCAHRLSEAAGPHARVHLYDGGHDEPANPGMQDALVAFFDEVDSPA